MKNPIISLLVRWAVLALGVALASAIVPGISYRDGGTLLVVAIVLSFFNAILKPLLLLFTLPFIVLTLGIGVLIINALLFLLVGHVVSGFEVAGFWSALFGAIIVSLTSMIVNGRLKGSVKTRVGRTPPSPPTTTPTPAHRPHKEPRRDDVIDI